MIHKLLSYSLALASILLLSSCGDSSKSHKSYESKVQCVENKVAETAKSMGTLETLSPEQTMQLTEKIAEFPKACEMTEEEQKKYFSKMQQRPRIPSLLARKNPPTPILLVQSLALQPLKSWQPWPTTTRAVYVLSKNPKEI